MECVRVLVEVGTALGLFIAKRGRSSLGVASQGLRISVRRLAGGIDRLLDQSAGIPGT
jgi:hypothetical protein